MMFRPGSRCGRESYLLRAPAVLAFGAALEAVAFFGAAFFGAAFFVAVAVDPLLR